MNKTLPIVQPFFDEDSHTISYVVWDPETHVSAIIDSVLDYHHKNITTDTKLADEIIAYITKHNLTNAWILETHLHADHISAVAYLKEKVGGKSGIGKEVLFVQKYLKETLELKDTFQTDGSQFDKLFADGDTFNVGSMTATAIHTPGHTPADMIYDIGSVLFAGDTLLAPDSGTARCDFPGGSAETLYDSVQKILTTHNPDTSIYLCHDYPEGKNRDMMYQTTVGEERQSNIHVRDDISKDEFVLMRTERDKTLDLPAYMFPAVQLNGNAGTPIPGEFIKLSLNKKVF